MITKTRTFIIEVISELKKVSWSSRKDVIEAAKVVFMSGILLGFFIGGIDWILSKILGLLIK
ncbi:MAG: preprotein translocase subunit SecE [Lysobacterales bacterium]|jgi:preprotein translocase subunit SecE